MAGTVNEQSGWDSRRLLAVIAVGITLIVGGTLLAAVVATSGGDVDVRETAFETDSGLELTATVYEPAEATADDPAPAVLLIHGYTGDRSTLSGFATELADRGYVAVTVDQPGHGDSAPPAFEDGWGGPASLAHVRSLETVDEDRVAMAGHSMGGFASLAAAEAHPDGYESVVLIGSTWGDGGQFEPVPEADETFPRNLAILFAPYDEYSLAMWGEPVPADVDESEKLAEAFDADLPVEHGETYGDVDAGTARTFAAPPTIHTGMHHSTMTAAETIEWVTLTTDGPTGAPSDDQQWYWMVFGQALALVGGLLLAVGTAAFVWRRLENDAGTETAIADGGHAVGGLPRSTAIGLSALPALTLYPLYALGTALVPVTRLTHQELTHGYVVWVLGTAAVAAGILRWRHGGVNRASLQRLIGDPKTAGKSFLAAGSGAAALYVAVAVVEALPGGGLGAWVVGFTALSGVRWFSVVVYVVPFTVAAVALAAGLDRTLDHDRSLPAAMGRGLAVTCGGLLALLALQYVPLLLGYGLPVPSLGPLAITAINATGALAAATLLAVATNRLTGSRLVSGLLVGLLVTWMVVGTGPIHVAPF